MIIIFVVIGLIFVFTVSLSAAQYDKKRLKNEIAYTRIIEKKPKIKTEFFANSRIYVNHKGKIGTSFSPKTYSVGTMVKFRVHYKNGHDAEYWTTEGDADYNFYMQKVIEI